MPKNKEKLPNDIVAMGFEQALQELETIVRQLENGDAALNEAIDLYERGALLKRHCEATLSAARMRIERITLHEDGDITSEPTVLEGV